MGDSPEILKKTEEIYTKQILFREDIQSFNLHCGSFFDEFLTHEFREYRNRNTDCIEVNKAPVPNEIELREVHVSIDHQDAESNKIEK